MPRDSVESPPTAERDRLVAGLLSAESPVGEAYSAFLARARQAHPDLAIDAEPFARHIASVFERATVDPIPELATLRAGDLYLACGCVLGNPTALARFDRQYVLTLRSFVKDVDNSAVWLDELRQALRERVLVARPGARPRLARYSGKGALAAWLAVIGRRLALSSVAAPRREEADADAALAERVAPGSNAESLWARLQHADRFQAAIQGALGALEPRHRLLLRLHLVEGVSLSRIAVSYGVSQSTVSRWFEQARQDVRRETKHRLCSVGGLDSSEIASLARDLESHLEIAISSVLGPERDDLDAGA